MQLKLLHTWAQEIAKKNNFKISKKIYEANYYLQDCLRNVIYSGIFNKKSAILKVYDDPRPTVESVSLKDFNKSNKSRKLIAPELYAFDAISSHKGWLIMEKLPEDGKFFSSPLNPEKRKEFLDIYLEYKRHFPGKPTRKLTLVEKLPANKFHLLRIGRWFELANDRELDLEMKGKKPFLDVKLFFPLYLKALTLMEREFQKRKMQWVHGHFKPKEIFYSPQNDIYYLTDFAHNQLFPEGYELAFMVWADHLQTDSWKLSYGEFRKITYEWLKDLRPIAKELKIKRIEALLRASMVERLIGYILADVCASDRPNKEKKIRLDYSLRLLEEFLK